MLNKFQLEMYKKFWRWICNFVFNPCKDQYLNDIHLLLKIKQNTLSNFNSNYFANKIVKNKKRSISRSVSSLIRGSTFIEIDVNVKHFP